MFVFVLCWQYVITLMYAPSLYVKWMLIVVMSLQLWTAVHSVNQCNFHRSNCIITRHNRYAYNMLGSGEGGLSYYMNKLNHGKKLISILVHVICILGYVLPLVKTIFF